MGAADRILRFWTATCIAVWLQGGFKPLLVTHLGRADLTAVLVMGSLVTVLVLALFLRMGDWWANIAVGILAAAGVSFAVTGYLEGHSPWAAGLGVVGLGMTKALRML